MLIGLGEAAGEGDLGKGEAGVGGAALAALATALDALGALATLAPLVSCPLATAGCTARGWLATWRARHGARHGARHEGDDCCVEASDLGGARCGSRRSISSIGAVSLRCVGGTRNSKANAELAKLDVVCRGELLPFSQHLA